MINLKDFMILWTACSFVLFLGQQAASITVLPFIGTSREALNLVTYFLCHVCSQAFLTLELACGVLENLGTKEKNSRVFFWDLENIANFPNSIINKAAIETKGQLSLFLSLLSNMLQLICRKQELAVTKWNNYPRSPQPLWQLSKKQFSGLTMIFSVLDICGCQVWVRGWGLAPL